MKRGTSRMIKSRYDRRKRNVLRHCLNISSDGADVTCDGRLTVPEVGAGNWKSPFANGGEVEQWYYKLVGTSVTCVKYDIRCAGTLPLTAR